MRKLSYLIPLLFLMWLFSGWTKGLFYQLTLNRDEILVKQLHGDGCGYQHLCDFSRWWFSGNNIRNADYHCRIMAASCMKRLGTPANVALPALHEAKGAMPSVYDTGDGVIYYLQHILDTIKDIEKDKYDSKD